MAEPPLTPGPDSRRLAWRWSAASILLLTIAGVVNMREWFTEDRLPLGDFPGYVAVVRYVRDAVLHYGRVPTWCTTCFGGSTYFVSSFKEYLTLPLALWLDPVLATKLMFLVAKVGAAFAMYLLFTRLFAAPEVGIVAAYAYAFSACANYEAAHFDVPISFALFPLVLVASVELLRRPRVPWAVALGVLLACQLSNNPVQAICCAVLLALLLALRPWRDGPRTEASLADRRSIGILVLAGLVFLAFAASVLAWLATDLGNHALLSSADAARQRELYVERSPFLLLNRRNWMGAWLATHQPPGLDVTVFDGERHYLGGVVLAVSLVGWFAARRRWSLRRWYQVVGLLLLVQYWLSLGPRTVVWEIAQSFQRGDLESGVRVGLTAAAAGCLAWAVVLAVRRRRGTADPVPVERIELFLGLALLLLFPAYSLGDVARRWLPVVGPLLGLQRSPGHFFDLVPFSLACLFGLALVALRARIARRQVFGTITLVLALFVALDFWPSTGEFARGTRMGVVRRAEHMLAPLRGEGGTLRLTLLPDYSPLQSMLAMSTEAGSAFSWLPWQAGRYWLPFVATAAWQGPAGGSATPGGAALLALGRLKYFLLESRDALPRPWRLRARKGAFSLWEQPEVVPFASSYRRWLRFTGEQDEAVLRIVPEAFRQGVLVVSAGGAAASTLGGKAIGLVDVLTGRWRALVAPAPPEPATRVAYDRPAPERIVLTTDAGPAPAVVLVSESYHPWWEATVDGAPAPVLRAEMTLMAVPVGPGSHRIEMRLRRPAVVAAADGTTTVAWIALLPAAAAYAIGRRRRRSAAGARDGP